MPSRRPVLIDIKTYGLDPSKAHSIGKNGRLQKKDASTENSHTPETLSMSVAQPQDEVVQDETKAATIEVVAETSTTIADTVVDPIVTKTSSKKGRKKVVA